jgi:transposase
MKITTIGVDLAKEVFQIHGVDAHGKAVLRKRLRRSEMVKIFANLEPCLIGMEACGSAQLGKEAERVWEHSQTDGSPVR